jgi:hypothetical protein
VRPMVAACRFARWFCTRRGDRRSLIHLGSPKLTAGLRRVDLDVLHGRLRVANNVVEAQNGLHEGPPKTKAGQRARSG